MFAHCEAANERRVTLASELASLSPSARTYLGAGSGLHADWGRTLMHTRPCVRAAPVGQHLRNLHAVATAAAAAYGLLDRRPSVDAMALTPATVAASASAVCTPESDCRASCSRLDLLLASHPN